MKIDINYPPKKIEQLLELVQFGEEIIFTNGEKQISTLTLQQPKPIKKRQPGRLVGLATLDDAFFEPLDKEKLAKI